MEIQIDSRNWFVSNSTRRTAIIKQTKTTKEAYEEFLRTGELNFDNKNTFDVNAFNLTDFPEVAFIPKNLKFYFPNLLALQIRRCNLRTISRHDFSSLIALRELHIESNFIEELHDDLLIDLKHLEIVRFLNNKIKFVGKDVFKNLEKLKYVDLTGNTSIDIIYADFSFKTTFNDYKFIRVYRLYDLNKIIEGFFHSSQINVDIQKVLKIDDFKDFIIKIGENKFKVHKLMLAARSPTIAEMIKNNPDASELIIEDIETDILKNILDYIYEEKLPEKTDEKLRKVLAAAERLNIEKLKDEVGKNLMDFVKPETSFEMLLIASQHGHEELKLKSFEELKKFLGAENLKKEMMDNIEGLNKLVNAKHAFDKMKKDFE